MKPISVLTCVVGLIVTLSCSSDEVMGDNTTTPPNNGAAYTVVFKFNWNQTDFPTDYPSNPHFSPLVGWVHTPDESLFKVQSLPTPGIEQMAETGATSTLVKEMNKLIAKGKGLSSYTGKGLTGGVGSIQIDIAVSKNHSAVSLATMLAPSPDWYVACVNVNLLDKEGKFVSDKEVVGYVHDAGTDNGTSFASSNSDTQPKKPISIITSAPLGDGKQVNPSFCTVTFTKK